MKAKRIGKNLRKFRELKEMTISDLAQVLEVDSQILIDFETKRKYIPLNFGLKLAEVLEFDPYFIGIDVPLDKKIPRNIFAPLSFKAKFTPLRFFWDFLKSMFGAVKKKKREVNTNLIENQLFSLEENTSSPFVFLRISLLLLGVAGLAYLADSVVISNFALSMVVPLGFMWFLFEAHHPRIIRGFELIKYFLYGGLISIIIVLFIRSFTGYMPFPIVGDLLTGLIEELAKIMTVIFLVRKKLIKNPLEGVLIGFAVGAGFTAFETTMYGMNELLTNLNMFDMIWLILVRSFYDLIGVGHHFWTGILAGVVVMISKTGHLKMRDLRNPVFFFWYLLMAMIHGLWNFNPLMSMTYVIAVVSLMLFIIFWSKVSIDYRLSLIVPEIEPIESVEETESVEPVASVESVDKEENIEEVPVEEEEPNKE